MSNSPSPSPSFFVEPKRDGICLYNHDKRKSVRETRLDGKGPRHTRNWHESVANKVDGRDDEPKVYL